MRITEVGDPGIQEYNSSGCDANRIADLVEVFCQMIPLGQAHRLSPITSDLVVSVNDMVTKNLREAVLQGRFRPGERLLQDQIASELGVSRQPVRGALNHLESEGLVIRLPGRSIVVRQYSEQEIRENYHLRQLLESEAARLCAERIKPRELQGLKSLNRSMAEAIVTDEISSLVDANSQFHRLVHASARLPTLIRLINHLWVGHTVFTALLIPGRAARSIEEHDAIIAALERRNPEEASAKMRAHIQQAETEFLAQA